MEARAVAKYMRISARKVRLVAENIKGKPVEEALNILKFTPKKGADMLSKVCILQLLTLNRFPEWMLTLFT